LFATGGLGRAPFTSLGPVRLAIPDQSGRPSTGESYGFKLIDAKAASVLLGVPHTWLLAQAREGRIPQRLGHYVRFNPEDLRTWLNETRSMPTRPTRGFR
jgi:hypothetical protein